MKVRSKSQFNKLKELLAQGAITLNEFQLKTVGIDPKTLPDRISTEEKNQVKKAPKRAW